MKTLNLFVSISVLLVILAAADVANSCEAENGVSEQNPECINSQDPGQAAQTPTDFLSSLKSYAQQAVDFVSEKLWNKKPEVQETTAQGSKGLDRDLSSGHQDEHEEYEEGDLHAIDEDEGFGVEFVNLSPFRTSIYW